MSDFSARSVAAQQRDGQAAARDTAAEQRDESAHLQDARGQHRDADGQERDRLGGQRDRSAAERDAEWDLLSKAAGSLTEETLQALVHIADAYAQHDRKDRAAAATDRTNAGFDRSSAKADRKLGSKFRELSSVDRLGAGADRGAAKIDRQVASRGDLSGAYSREAGLVELDRELLRARDTEQALSVAYLEVDGLDSVDNPAGHVVIDRNLAHVVSALRHVIKPYDVIVRMGDEQLLCVFAGHDESAAAQRIDAVSAELLDTRSVASLRTGRPTPRPRSRPRRMTRRRLE
jgi:GGDEF domain-containing protein